MSRIYFHSEHGTSEVRGWERAYAGGLCTDLLATALSIDSGFDFETPTEPHPLRRVVEGYPRTAALGTFLRTMRTWIGGFSDDSWFLYRNGQSVNSFSTALNTAFVMGSDPVRLLARLHGQCEIHAFVEGPNRAWLADIIERGRASGIMRAESGWEETIVLLRSRDDCPVVTSYSVCEQFPNRSVARWTPPEDDEDGDTWYDLTDAEQWRLGLEGLRSSNRLEMRPDDWEGFIFNTGVNGFNILEYANELVKDTIPAARSGEEETP